MEMVLKRMANITWFCFTFYLAWLQIPATPQILIRRSRKIYAAQCVALILIVASGSAFSVNWYVQDNTKNILHALRDAQFELYRVVGSNISAEDRQYILDTIRIFKTSE